MRGSTKLNNLKIENKTIGDESPVYFIADIAANHDGKIERAKELIWRAKDCGADAAKFQHFKAETIVSDHGFKALKEGESSHQSSWKKSVFDVYRDASVSEDWTQILFEECKKADIHFFTSPYDLNLVDHVDPYVPAYKIGSGDITWSEMLKYIASKNKPYMLATGASNIEEVIKAVSICLDINSQFVLMQCNTNYTAKLENFNYINLNVLKKYREIFPRCVLGLSDHTPGHSTVLGAVALGAKVVEKHFTDDNNRPGPDHTFAMNPRSWREMVDRTREVELALGDGIKRVEGNEVETVVLQRRALCASRELSVGCKLKVQDFIALRPCPLGSLGLDMQESLVGRVLKVPKAYGERYLENDFE